MKRYTAELLSETTGLSLTGATLEVVATGTATRVPLYATDNTAGPLVAQPVPNGTAFYVADGRYDLIARSGGRKRTIPELDLFDGFEQNRRLEAVENGEPGAAGSLRADLLADDGGSRVAFLQAGAGAIRRDVQSQSRETLSATQFGYGKPGNTPAQNTAALEAAIAYQQTVAGVLRIPYVPGVFINPLTIVLTGAPLILVGDGQLATVLRKPANTPDPILTIQSTGNLYPYTFISGIRFDNGFRAPASGIGVKLIDVPRFVFDRCHFHGCAIGVRGEGALIGSFIECSALNNDIGYDFTKSAAGIFANLLSIERGEIQANKLGVRLDNGTGLYIDRVDLEHNGIPGDLSTGAIHFGNSLSSEAGYANIWIRGWFEGNNGITIKGVSPGVNSTITLDQSIFISNEAPTEVQLSGWKSIKLNAIVAPTGTWTTQADDFDSDITSIVSTLVDTSAHGPVNLRTQTQRFYNSMDLARIRAKAHPFAAQDLLMSTDDQILGGPTKDVGFAKYGDGEFWLGTTAAKRIRMDTVGLGFYGVAPVVRPAAVPVTAAGVHAALVTLGLITG